MFESSEPDVLPVDGEALMVAVGTRSVEARFGEVIAEPGGLSEVPPSGLLLDVLASLSPAALDADEALDAARAVDRVISLAQAVQAGLLQRFAALRPGQDREVSEFAADEVAPALRISRGQAAGRLGLAHDLAARLPETLAALHRGEIDLVKARAVSELTSRLPAVQARAVAARVLSTASVRTAPQLRAAIRREVLKVDAAGAQRREAAARTERRVVVTPADDGMAELYALLPAPEAVAIYDRVNRLAKTCPADDRTMDARRADAFVDLLLGDGQRRVNANIHVTVPATTLLSSALPGGQGSRSAPSALGDEPGHLAGYGPITAATARDLAGGVLGGDTAWRRILTDPADGSVLDVGRRSYRPPKPLADQIRVRDKVCRFPGCRQPAHRCDIDHTIPYPEGETAADNLGLLCRHHHRLKHETDWRLTQNDRGGFVWTSPTGRDYATGPPDV